MFACLRFFIGFRGGGGGTLVRPPPRGGGQNFSLLATVLRGLAGWLVALLVAFVVFFASATVKENFFSPFSGDPAPLLAPPPRQLCLPLTTVFTATLNACPSSSQLFQQFSEMGGWRKNSPHAPAAFASGLVSTLQTFLIVCRAICQLHYFYIYLNKQKTSSSCRCWPRRRAVGLCVPRRPCCWGQAILHYYGCPFW